MGTAVLLGSRCEPGVELSFGIDDRHPATGELLRVWVKGLPGRRWDARGKLWRVPVSGLPAGTLTAAGFEVTTLAGHPVGRSVLAPGPGRYQDGVGKVPDWFGLELDDYQKLGAEKIAGGGKALCDAMGLGKTRQLLAAAAILSPTRTLILCPPVVLTHWERETGQSSLVEHAVGAPDDLAPPSTQTGAPDGNTSIHETASNSSTARLVVVHPRRKVPDLPDTGVVIVPDTLVAARRQLLTELCAWAPQVLVYDEAHRAKTWESARSLAARSLAGATGGVVLVATGTPMFARPDELVPLFDMTGSLRAVFGGRDAFLARYMKEIRFGKDKQIRQLVPRAERLPELRSKLEGVWVRRTKDDIAQSLPPKTRRAMIVDVDRRLFDTAHREVAAAVGDWLDAYQAATGTVPDDDEIDEWCRGNLAYVSSLRRAAGLSKIPAAADHVHDWVSSTISAGTDGTLRCSRPLVVWTHHKEVTQAMAQAARQAVDGLGAGTAETIAGGTPPDRRSRIVDAFQAGRVPVLVASIHAAGVGITLTRSSDVLFVETDWTPAVVAQAEDRCHRRGQANHVTVTTMIAPGTLDEQIQTVLGTKADTLDATMTGDHRVGTLDDTQMAGERTTAAQLLARIVHQVIASRSGRRSGKRAA